MNWISDHFQIVILILFGIGSVFKGILEAKAKAKAEKQGEQEQEYEDEIDWGESALPPQFPRPIVSPTLREAGYEEAVAQENAKALKHQKELADRLRQIRDTKATTTGGAAATRHRLAQKGKKQVAVTKSVSIKARLKNPAELRKALVMREILDVPVSLR